MLHLLSIKIADIMGRDKIIFADQVNICAYGLELLLSTIVGILALVIVSLLGGFPFLWIPYLMGFVPIRLTAGGYHAGTHVACISLFTVMYILVAYFVEFSVLSGYICFFTSTLNLLVVLKFSPVEALNKPLSVRHKMNNREYSLVISFVNLCISLILAVYHLEVITFIAAYFAGSNMATLTLLIAVIKRYKKEHSCNS